MSLDKLQHPVPKRLQHAPHKWILRNYGAHSQIAPLSDTTPPLPPAKKKYVHQVVGGCLYYGGAVDNTVLPAVNQISTQQANSTTNTLHKTPILFDYLYAQPHAKLRFLANQIQLKVHSDTAYLVAPQFKSKIGEYFHLGRVTSPQYLRRMQTTKTYRFIGGRSRDRRNIPQLWNRSRNQEHAGGTQT